MQQQVVLRHSEQLQPQVEPKEITMTEVEGLVVDLQEELEMLHSVVAAVPVPVVLDFLLYLIVTVVLDIFMKVIFTVVVAAAGVKHLAGLQLL
jgi:hypothetical protein